MRYTRRTIERSLGKKTEDLFSGQAECFRVSGADETGPTARMVSVRGGLPIIGPFEKWTNKGTNKRAEENKGTNKMDK